MISLILPSVQRCLREVRDATDGFFPGLITKLHSQVEAVTLYFVYSSVNWGKVAHASVKFTNETSFSWF